MHPCFQSLTERHAPLPHEGVVDEGLHISRCMDVSVVLSHPNITLMLTLILAPISTQPSTSNLTRFMRPTFTSTSYNSFRRWATRGGG